MCFKVFLNMHESFSQFVPPHLNFHALRLNTNFHAPQDFLPVFAAGNEGMGTFSSNGGLTTVTSPATAKNCITVGASRSNGRSDNFQDKYDVYTMVVSQAGTGDAQEVESYRVCANLL